MIGFDFGEGMKIHIKDIAFTGFDAAIGGNNLDLKLTNVHAYKTKTMVKGRDLKIKASHLIHDEHRSPYPSHPVQLTPLAALIRRINNAAI